MSKIHSIEEHCHYGYDVKYDSDKATLILAANMLLVHNTFIKDWVYKVYVS